MVTKSTDNKRILFTLLKALLLGAGLYWFVHNWDNTHLSDTNIDSVFDNLKPFYIILSILLFILSWLLEAKKWQYLIKKTENMSLQKSLMSVLSGTTASAFIPYKMGAYLGRMLYLKTRFKIRAIPATIIGNLLQSSITFILGAITIFFVGNIGSPEKNLFLILAVLVLILIATLPFYYKRIAKYINALYRRIIQKKKLKLVSLYERETILKAWFLSLLRYLAFTLHFVLILKGFGVNDGIFELALAISLIYFLQSFFPSLIVVDFGVKYTIALSVFMQLNLALDIPQANLTTILGLHYLLNSIIPVIVGATGLLFLKIKNK